MSRRPSKHARGDLWRTAALCAVVVAAGVVAVTAPPVEARQSGPLPDRVSSSPRPGAWTQLGTAQGGGTPALFHMANGNELVVWAAPEVVDNYHYEFAELKPSGDEVSSPKNVFGSHDWSSVTFSPTLVSYGGRPLLIFEGGRDSIPTDPYSRSCIVGDVLSSSGWKLQTWSLSASCANPDHFGATSTKSGTLSAAWPGGWANGIGVLYRVGASSSIPAAGSDQHISTVTGDAGNISEVTESKSQHIYAVWIRFFSKPTYKDGIWVSDLSTKSSPVKAPGTGTNLVASFPEPVAAASPSGRGGVYLAYCNNASPCSHVELWRYGAKKAVTVPKSSNARSVALSGGPSGRLWIAWWSEKNGTVSVVRTNEAGDQLGPVETHAGPHGCTGDGNGTIRAGGGPQQRLDVVISCFDFSSAHGAVHVSETQSLVPLRLATTTPSVSHKKNGTVAYRVSDVGDAVQGANVSVDGKKGTTDKKGQVTFHFAKGSKPGYFKVVAWTGGYLSASSHLRIT